MGSENITEINQKHVDEIKELRNEIIALRISIATLIEADKRYFEKFINLTEKQVELGKEIEKYKLKFEQKFEELEKWKYKITGILISITASAGVLQQLILSLLDNS